MAESNFISTDFKAEGVTPGIRSQFDSTPWAIKLLDDPSFRSFSHRIKFEDPSYTGDTFVSRTLNTEDTIIVWQSFAHPAATQDGFEEVLFLLKLGSGLNGHMDICHGGFVSFLMDEVMGCSAERARSRDAATMTAFIKVDFKRPLPTPSIVLCRSTLTRRQGRKMWMKSSIEDGEGLVFATGESLFLEVEAVKPRERL